MGSLVGRTYKFVAGTGMMTLGRKTIDLYARAESILGANLVRQVLDFYSLFVSIAEGYAERAVKTVEMLKDPAITEFRVVTIPQKAVRDAQFFHEELSRRRFPIGALYVNRVWGIEPGPEFPEGLARRVMDWYKSVRVSQVAAVDEVTAHYRKMIPRIASLPELAQDVDGRAPSSRLPSACSWSFYIFPVGPAFRRRACFQQACLSNRRGNTGMASRNKPHYLKRSVSLDPGPAYVSSRSLIFCLGSIGK